MLRFQEMFSILLWPIEQHIAYMAILTPIPVPCSLNLVHSGPHRVIRARDRRRAVLRLVWAPTGLARTGCTREGTGDCEAIGDSEDIGESGHNGCLVESHGHGGAHGRGCSAVDMCLLPMAVHGGSETRRRVSLATVAWNGSGRFMVRSNSG